MLYKQELDTIIKYLGGEKNWTEGMALYQKFGKNEGLKRMFERIGDTSYNRSKLMEELLKLAQKPPKGKPRIKTVKSVTRPEEGDPKPKGLANHPEVKKLYQERSMLHAQLMQVQTEGERKGHAFRILELTKQVEDFLYGRKPLKKDKALPKDRAEMKQRILNNRGYISRFKDRPDKIDEVLRRRVENDQLEQLLKKKEK